MYGLHHHLGFHDHPAAAVVDDLQSLISRIPGLTAPERMLSSCTDNTTAATEASIAAGGGGGAPSAGADSVSTSSSVKAMIASHPRYPRLLEAYIDCQKVDALSSLYLSILLFFFFFFMHLDLLCLRQCSRGPIFTCFLVLSKLFRSFGCFFSKNRRITA